MLVLVHIPDDRNLAHAAVDALARAGFSPVAPCTLDAYFTLEQMAQFMMPCAFVVLSYDGPDEDIIDLARKLDIPIRYSDDYCEGIADPIPVEAKCPRQSRRFRELLGTMYRTYLKKNQDYCLAPGTRVLTDDLRWVPIETLEVGDTLVGFDEDVSASVGHRRMYRPSTVEAVSTVRLPSYRIHLEDGQVFVASSQHPWLVQSGLTSRWVTTERLQAQDTHKHPSKLLKVLDTWDTADDYEGGYLAAAFDGEGWLSQKEGKNGDGPTRGKGFQLGFAQKSNAMLAQVLTYLDKRGLTYRFNDPSYPVRQLTLGKPRRDIIKLLGELQPRRLMQNLSPELGMVDLRRPVDVARIEFIGETELIAMQTSTRTFVAEGYATHNSSANIAGMGEFGLITRIWDKVARLLSLTGFDIQVEFKGYAPRNDPAQCEPLHDTYLDLAVYGVVGRIYKDGLWGK